MNASSERKYILSSRQSVECEDGYYLEVNNLLDRNVAYADGDELPADDQMLMTELQESRDRLKDRLTIGLLGTREPSV